MATRRAFLGQVALGLGVVACRGALAQPAERAAYVGVETSAATGLSRARFFTASGAPGGSAALDFRAHGMAAHDGRLLVFPRRPGTRFAAVDLATLEILGVVQAPPDRHFYGHGAFTADGRHLLVTENDLATLRGTLGVYETGSLRRLGEIALPGPGPHEIVRDPARDLFYIALGGLETHPAYGRTPLNLGAFRSQVVRHDFARGLTEPMGHWPGSEGISLRHLAIDGTGRLYVGGQLADPRRGTPDRVLWLCRDGDAESIDDGQALAGYVSSVACHGTEVRVTSKEGNAALGLHGADITRTTALTGASAAALGPGIEALSGYGALRLNGTSVAVTEGYEFDNHGLAVG